MQLQEVADEGDIHVALYLDDEALVDIWVTNDSKSNQPAVKS